VRYQGGVDLGFQFGSLSVMTGIRYLQRGVKTSENRDDPNGKHWIGPNGMIDVGERIYTSKFSFIGFPVLARYRLGSGPIQFGLALGPRSEEHTSELQSRGHLVCRLLPEDKKLYRDNLH